jgi:hypothetical protein
MKMKSILLASALSLGLAASALAQQQGGVSYVYMTGSTAFRPAIYLAVSNVLYSVANPAVTITTYKPTGTDTNDPSLASYMLFSNTVSGTPTIIKCAWSGSEAGYIDAKDLATENFPADSLFGPAGQLTINQNNPADTDAEKVDIILADNDVAHSRSSTTTFNTKTNIGYIPFIWVKNAQTNASAGWNSVTNVTDQQVFEALSGNANAALFDGVAGDETGVYVAGRDYNSGTRVNATIDCGFGYANSAIDQIEINASTGAIVGSNFQVSSAGQSSGGTLANTLNFPGTAQVNDPIAGQTGYYAIAYLGLYDADAALGINNNTPPAYPAVPLAFNGVVESSNTVTSGQYSFWGNEWIVQGNSASATGQSYYTKLVAEIPSHADGYHTFSAAMMHAKKATSGADPVAN